MQSSDVQFQSMNEQIAKLGEGMKKAEKKLQDRINEALILIQRETKEEELEDDILAVAGFNSYSFTPFAKIFLCTSLACSPPI